MEADEDKATAITVNLSPTARRIVEAIRADTGIPAKTAVERYFEWLGARDAKFRLAILNRDRDVQAELTRLVLREMAGINDATPNPVGPALTFEECQQVIQKMLERMHHLQQQTENALGNALKKRK